MNRLHAFRVTTRLGSQTRRRAENHRLLIIFGQATALAFCCMCSACSFSRTWRDHLCRRLHDTQDFESTLGLAARGLRFAHPQSLQRDSFLSGTPTSCRGFHVARRVILHGEPVALKWLRASWNNPN